MFEPFFVLDPEALLLVDDHQAQIFELHVLRKQAVGADSDIDSALGQIHHRSLQLLERAEPAEHLHPYRERLETALESLKMLKYENCSRRQDHHLLAIAESHNQFRASGDTDVRQFLTL